MIFIHSGGLRGLAAMHVETLRGGARRGRTAGIIRHLVGDARLL